MSRRRILGSYFLTGAAVFLGTLTSAFAQSSTDAFIDAVVAGREREVNAALDHDPALATMQHYGTPILLIAVKSEQPQVVEMLLKRGAKVDASDDGGRTALMWAIVRRVKMEIVKTLLDARADVDTRDSRGWSPVEEARRLGEQGCCLDLLVSKSHARLPADDNGQKLPFVVLMGAVGGILFPILEVLEGRRRLQWRRVVTLFLFLPALGALLVYVAVSKGATLPPPVALQIGIAAPSIIRAWKKKPLAFDEEDA